MRTLRVVVACGLPVVCEAIASRLDCEDQLLALSAPGPLETIGVGNGTIASLAPNVVVVHADDERQVQLITGLQQLQSHPAVVALVHRDSSRLAARLIAGGVSAVVSRTAPSEELVQAVRWAANGSSWISPPLLRDVLEHLFHEPQKNSDPRLERLTARERQILQLMVDGFGRQQMAEHLNLSIDTVRTHMRTTMEKLDAHSATAAVSIALEAGLRPSPSREGVVAYR